MKTKVEDEYKKWIGKLVSRKLWGRTTYYLILDVVEAIEFPRSRWRYRAVTLEGSKSKIYLIPTNTFTLFYKEVNHAKK